MLNLLDRLVGFVAPVAAARRMRARLAMEALGSYTGASKSRRSLKEWKPFGSDADSDILPDLTTLRDRSRDLVRNHPLAGGAIKTKVTHVVGTGFRLQSRIDRDVVNLDEEAADALEATIEREWRLFFDTKDLDITRTQTGNGLTQMVYQQAKENGDVFILLPRTRLMGSPYALRIQVVEADRCCNKDNALDTDTLSGGIQKDEVGAPLAYHILDVHPGKFFSAKANTWREIPAFGEKTGLRNIIHLYKPTRPGQSRGVPDLAPVIELFKQLSRYTEAEIMAAVISGFFTVFIESEPGGGATEFDYSNLGDEAGQKDSDKDMKLGNGLIMELNPGEKIHDSNPGRPNANFDPFVLAILRQIGCGLEIPFEILIKHFTASYSAARAALLEFWAYVKSERQWLVENFLQIVFEIWMYEAVASGRISAPGFFADAGIRKAYCGCVFVGPAKGQINEQNEVKAAVERIDAGLSTLAHETTELTGQDWERNHKQQTKEKKMRIADGLDGPKQVGTETISDNLNVSAYEDLKIQLDAYGVGVRAGAITPQQADEENFRTILKLPPITEFVKEAWNEDDGFRRPITLSSGQLDVKNNDDDTKSDDKEGPDEQGTE